jgi:hypothetical protein
MRCSLAFVRLDCAIHYLFKLRKKNVMSNPGSVEALSSTSLYPLIPVFLFLCSTIVCFVGTLPVDGGTLASNAAC